jgi:sporulation integral membrane protein YlbJ
MKLKSFFLLLTVLFTACVLLIFPAAASEGAHNGIDYCLRILIPSLYPFMVISVFIVKSGLSDKIGRLLEAPIRAVLKLPGSTAATILMSMIGGYPTGARSIAALYENGSISENQAARMLCFCVNAGPAFVISAVGAGFLKNPQAGALLFASQILASLILSLLSGWKATNEPVPAKRKTSRTLKISDALIASASDAAHAMMNMCCFVVLFAALINLLRLQVTEPHKATALSALLEVTGGCADIAKLGAPLWVFALAIGWGGICVHFQVLSSVGEIKIRLARFLFFRLLHGLLAAGITSGLLRIFPASTEVFSNTSAPLASGFSASAPASAVLVGLCVVFLLYLPDKEVEIGEN